MGKGGQAGGDHLVDNDLVAGVDVIITGGSVWVLDPNHGWIGGQAVYVGGNAGGCNLPSWDERGGVEEGCKYSGDDKKRKEDELDPEPGAFSEAMDDDPDEGKTKNKQVVLGYLLAGVDNTGGFGTASKDEPDEGA